MDNQEKGKINIFYFSLKYGEDRQPVLVRSVMYKALRAGYAVENLNVHQVVFVRCELAKSDTLEGALDEANPRDDESVMNTHFLE